MKKIALLTSKDLSQFITDEDCILNAYEKIKENLNFELETCVWSDPIDWSRYDKAVIRTAWDYQHHLEEFLKTLAEIEKSGCKLYNPSEVVAWNAKKTYLADIESQGLPVIPTLFLDQTDFEEAFSGFKKDHKKFVLKPIVGAGAANIKTLNPDDVTAYCSNLGESKSNWFLQPFIDSVLDGEKSIFILNGKFSHAVKKVPKKNDFRVQEEHGASIHPYTPSEKEIEFAKKAASIKENIFYARVDFLDINQSPHIIELELIEPSFYFRVVEQSAANFIQFIKSL